MWSIPRSVSKPAPRGGALFVRIANAISDDIRRGVLRAGDRLPSTRTLARELDVNRNTVVAAFAELVAQGWIETGGARGTRVTEAMADARPTRGLRPQTPSTPVARAGFEVRTIAVTPTPFTQAARVQLSAGVPDTRLLPHALLARAYRRALHARGRRATLDYAPPHGAMRLRV
ncbi:MAG TPA: GntR family transcriptional regulator, partial [Kofleriaceae bacterium]|nr:GntR family transcriptional regulator [Kofleriaceae bacterium]